MSKFTTILFSACLGAAILSAPVQAVATTKDLNVLVVLVDDLGQTDLGCYGSKFYETPHLDRLAEECVKFTHAYSACTVCSPTRAALLTGKYPARLHLTDWIPGHGRPQAKLLPPEHWAQELPLAERTLAEGFKTAGYATASIGKWHLGKEGFYPEQQGFDLNLAGTHAGQPPSYFSPYGIATLTDGPKGEFLTDREAVEAGKFMEAKQAGKFFIYLPLHAVHTPIMGKPEVVAKYKAKPGEAQGKPAYAALVESMDDAIGVLRKKLEDLKLWERTIIVFTSDNGGLLNITTNLGMRAGKGSAYEGGVRIPLLVRVPGLTKGGTACSVPVITPDLFATLGNLALPAGSLPAQDGRDLTPLLRGETKLPEQVEQALFWHYPHYHPGGATPYSAVRLGSQKLIHFYEENRDEVYDLETDPKEATDLSAAQPALTKSLRARLEAWLKATDAQRPRPNPAAQ